MANKVPLIPEDQAPSSLTARVLGELLAHGPLTSADIARRVQSSRGAVGDVVKDLQRQGFVSERGTQRSHGRPGVLQGIHPGAGWVVGVDLGGTNVRVAVCNVEGELLGEIRRPTPTARATDVAVEIETMVDHIAQATGTNVHAVLALCVGVPGTVDPRGNAISNADNLAIINGPDFIAAMRRRWHGQVHFDNDVTLAAVGEWVSRSHSVNAGDESADLTFLSLGTGMGMGVVINGQPWRGAHGAAGEIGLVPRSLTQSASLESLFVETTQDADVTTETVLAHALEIVSRILDPSVIVVGGGRIHDQRLVECARATLASRVSPLPRIETSQLGDQAGLIGALATGLSVAHSELIAQVVR